MTRRVFLLGVGVGAAALACDAHPPEAGPGPAPTADAISAAIAAHLGGLNIPAEAVQHFRAAWLGRARPGNAGGAEIARVFLLSSTFFEQGCDPHKPLAFVRLYGPFDSPCYNPIARYTPPASGEVR